MMQDGFPHHNGEQIKNILDLGKHGTEGQNHQISLASYVSLHGVGPYYFREAESSDTISELCFFTRSTISAFAVFVHLSRY